MAYAQQRITATTDDLGSVRIRDIVPPAWSDVAAVIATANDSSCMCVRAIQVGPDEFVCTAFRQVNGQVERVAHKQIMFSLVVFGS